MTSAENICSLCICTFVKFYHLKDSIKAPSHLRFEGHTDLQVVLEKILNKKGQYRKASNVICRNCHVKLHKIYALTHQHTESEKIFHQINDVTVRLKKLKTFLILTDLKTELGAIAETDKDADSPECSSTVADIKCDNSIVSKMVVKNKCGSNFEGTDFSKLTKDLSVGLLEREYSNVADGRSDEQKKINSIGIADSEQITIGEEIIKGEYTMQEGEIFEAKTKHDILNRDQTKFSCDECNEVFATVSYFSEHTRIVHENDSQDFNQADAELNTKKEEHTQRLDTMKEFACDKCDAKYKNKRMLWVHKMTHLGATLKCNKCHRHFHSDHALDNHKRAHCVALFECDMCDAEFKTKSSLEEHKLSHTNELLGCKYYCCNAKFTTKASLRHHRLSRICKSCKCVQCDIKLSNKKSLREHLKMVHSITNYSCDQCERKFKYKYRLREHKQWHAGVVFKCDHCDITLKSKSTLNSHKKIHDGILFNCDQCDAKFKSSAGLRQHKMVHAGITFACNQCDASLSSKWSLKNHQRKVHTNELRGCKYYCCNTKFTTKASLRHHRLSRICESFKCDQCDVKLSNKQSLRQHLMMVHSIIKNYSCDQCEKKFKYKHSLKVHKQSHTGVVFKCDHCDATLKSKSTLNSHKKIHDGILFNCDECDAKFKSSAGLRQHKMSHTGIKFGCNQCDAKYKSSSGLRQHKMVHAGITFACNQCDASLSSKWSLKNHQRKVHTNELRGCKYYCCNTKFTTKASLRHHRLSRICESFKCVQCDVKLSNKKSLREHLKMVHLQTVHQNALFACEHCDAIYKNKQTLNTHKMFQHTSYNILAKKA